MSGGDSLISKQDEKEPDALTMWFARERKAWWRKWRWLVVVFWALFAIDILFWAQHSMVQFSPWYAEFWRTTLLSLSVVGWLLEFHASYWGAPEALLVGLASFLAYSQSPNRMKGADWRIAYDANLLYLRIVQATRNNSRRWLLPCLLAVLVFVFSVWLDPHTYFGLKVLALKLLNMFLMLVLISEWTVWMNSKLTSWLGLVLVAALSPCWFFGAVEGIEMFYWNLLRSWLVPGSSYSEQITETLTGFTLILLALAFYILAKYPPPRYREILYSD